ncbi:MAG TPA: hypothetical protein VHA55_04465 [Pseudorhodoplanes sp.]|jgi:hypothetical protein|nr:hypothetical protein [Pseudorhodoplanes sp.]
MPQPDLSQHLATAQTMIRFALRMIILCVCAAFGHEGFARTLVTLLVCAAAYCAGAGIVRRDHPLGPALAHWDESAAYAAIACLLRIAA